VRTRDYRQFCGLARAAEVLGQRWTLLILRDLRVGPRRYTDLRAGLPGVPTNMLATRLKELETDGLVLREVRSSPDRSIVYRLTPRGAELAPALDALARWGAAGMREPREGEVVTEASLVTALRVAAIDNPTTRPPVVYVVRVANAVASATVADGVVVVEPGEHPDPDLVIGGGARFRDLLAGRLDPQEALTQGAVELEGDPELLATFTETFRVPYSDEAQL
jgi:DNA-binding HxlR family transcriptional regulator